MFSTHLKSLISAGEALHKNTELLIFSPGEALCLRGCQGEAIEHGFIELSVSTVFGNELRGGSRGQISELNIRDSVQT